MAQPSVPPTVVAAVGDLVEVPRDDRRKYPRAVEGNGENNRRRLGFPVDGDFSDRHDRTRVEVLCVGAVVISNEYVNS